MRKVTEYMALLLFIVLASALSDRISPAQAVVECPPPENDKLVLLVTVDRGEKPFCEYLPRLGYGSAQKRGD